MPYDTYYQKAYDYYQSDNLMYRAGWIDEAVDSPYDIHLLTTPFNKLNIKKGVINKIILTTGSFGPIHDGHIAMVEKAREALVEKGYHVAGGYMSPSHDRYVSTKKGMDMNVHDRIQEMHRVLDDNEWLMVDVWESLYAKTNINFTTVIERLSQYLSYWLKETVEIVYVFGSDNIEFSYAFHGKGSFVCVSREASIDAPKTLVMDESRMVFWNAPRHPMSSTQIREARVGKEKVSVLPTGEYYYIRDDHTKLGINVTQEDVEKIRDIIEHYSGKKSVMIDVNSQIEVAKERLKGKRTVSLDRYFDGDINADLCREFAVSDAQIAPQRIIERSGGDSKSLEVLEDEQYVFVDDDISSGRTLQMFKDRHPNIVINDYFFMNTLTMEQEKTYDIVDIRDFIVGADFGGLCVRMPAGDIARVPYMAPYVNLTTRASIDPNKAKAMTLALWRVNMAIFEREGLTIDEMHPLSHPWLKSMGFLGSDRMDAVCQWHINRLEE